MVASVPAEWVRRGGRRVTPAALAACAGAVDLLAVGGLGGAFASVVTGNLVTVWLGLGAAGGHPFVAPAVAVGGYAAGVLAGEALRGPGPLAAEAALLAGVAAGWIATGGNPGLALSLSLLAAAAVGMGVQSVYALRLRESTTYFTGTLTAALQDLLAGRRGNRAAAVGQLAALSAGAVLAAVLLGHLRWAVPLLPLLLLVVAVLGRPLMTRD